MDSRFPILQNSAEHSEKNTLFLIGTVAGVLLLTMVVSIACQQLPTPAIIGAPTTIVPDPEPAPAEISSTSEPQTISPLSEPPTSTPTLTSTPLGGELPPENPAGETARTLGSLEPVQVPSVQLIGYSTGGHAIEAYRFGEGPLRVALIGGIHGGYEWNTILLAYEMMDYFTLHPEAIPPEITVYVVPSANPDGQFLVTGMEGRFSAEDIQSGNWVEGRFNNNGVDLNRNWGCNWEAVGYLGDIEVSAGSRPFSEVETRALRNFFQQEGIQAIVFWHSAAGRVFPGECEEPFPPAQALGRAYAWASGYYYQDIFTSYTVTGDATGWLASIGVPGIVVELTTRADTEFAANLAGVRAVFTYMTQKSE